MGLILRKLKFKFRKIKLSNWFRMQSDVIWNNDHLAFITNWINSCKRVWLQIKIHITAFLFKCENKTEKSIKVGKNIWWTPIYYSYQMWNVHMKGDCGENMACAAWESWGERGSEGCGWDHVRGPIVQVIRGRRQRTNRSVWVTHSASSSFLCRAHLSVCVLSVWETVIDNVSVWVCMKLCVCISQCVSTCKMCVYETVCLTVCCVCVSVCVPVCECVWVTFQELTTARKVTNCNMLTVLSS